MPAAGYVSVSLYVDDRGSAKELPVNERATALVSGVHMHACVRAFRVPERDRKIKVRVLPCGRA